MSKDQDESSVARRQPNALPCEREREQAAVSGVRCQVSGGREKNLSKSEVVARLHFKLNRRGFMQSAVCGAGLASIFPSALASPSLPDFQAWREAHKPFGWENVIFAQFHDEALAGALEKLAESLGSKVYWGEGPDLVACSGWIRVIDRTVVGKEIWQFYLDFLEEVFDGQMDVEDGEVIFTGRGKEPPLILIDTYDSFPDPKPATCDYGSLRLYRCPPSNISEIISIIEIEEPVIKTAKLKEIYARDCRLALAGKFTQNMVWAMRKRKRP